MLTRCTNKQHVLETDSVCDLCCVPRCSSMYHRAYLYRDKSLYMFTLSMRGLLIPFYLMSVCMHLVTTQARRTPSLYVESNHTSQNQAMKELNLLRSLSTCRQTKSQGQDSNLRSLSAAHYKCAGIIHSPTLATQSQLHSNGVFIFLYMDPSAMSALNLRTFLENIRFSSFPVGCMYPGA